MNHVSKRAGLLSKQCLLGKYLRQGILRQNNLQVLGPGQAVSIVCSNLIEVFLYHTSRLGCTFYDLELVVDYKLNLLKVWAFKVLLILNKVLNLVEIVLSQSLNLQASQLTVVVLMVLDKFLVLRFEKWLITTEPQSVTHHQVAQTFQLHTFKI